MVLEAYPKAVSQQPVTRRAMKYAALATNYMVDQQCIYSGVFACDS
jgi:hypothetical protein